MVDDPVWQLRTEHQNRVSRALHKFVMDNLVSQAKSAWRGNDIVASDALSNAISELASRWPDTAELEKLVEKEP